MIDNTQSKLKEQMEKEIQQYLTETVSVGDNFDYSQPKLVRRISLFENKVYPKGKFDKQGNYKYWYDVIAPAIDSEVKNVDFDTSNITAYSPNKQDEIPCLITNLKFPEYLRVTGQAEEINSAIEEGSGWGNVVWKKIKGSYERMDLRNTYIINQTAFSLDETPVIERHQMISSDLRGKLKVWQNVKEVLEQCKVNTYKTEMNSTGEETTVPYFDIYERNGEVCLADLKRTNGENPKEGDEDVYVLAKVIGAGTKGQTNGTSIQYLVYAEQLTGKKMSDIYKEYHRGRYKGKWFREGLYELLFDIQVRANQIGNQIAQGLEYAAKKVLWSPDKLVMQSIVTDIKNGDIIRATNLQSVDMRMGGMDQLIADWNRIIELRNEIANSREIVTGEAPSGQPFRLGALLNQNANKLFEFIREKLAIPFSQIFEQWIVPEQIKDITAQDILRLTGDSTMMERLCTVIVDNWYLENLLSFPPHTNDIAQAIKAEAMTNLKSRPQLLMTSVKKMFEGFKPRVSVIITGEQLNLDAELQTLGSFVGLEQDPVRRSAIIEVMARKKGLDFGSLPKSPPMAPVVSPTQSARPMQENATGKS